MLYIAFKRLLERGLGQGGIKVLAQDRNLPCRAF
jgi:hypothetical protein